MWHRFWPAFLALTLGCAESEADRYEPQACAGCSWVVPFGVNADVQRLASDGQQLYWLQRWTQRLLRVPTTGGEPEEVAAWLEASRGLLIDESALYTCEANPPAAYGSRVVRIDKASFALATLAAGNVSSVPTLADETLYYFELVADENQLWQQPSHGGERQPVLKAGRALFPSSPTLLGDDIAWCADADAGITLFRYSKASDTTTTHELNDETSCPDLVVMNGQLFGVSERDGGTLLRFEPDGPTVVTSAMTGDNSGNSWSTSPVAGKLALLTQLGGREVRLVDERGQTLWSQDVPFLIQAPAASDPHGIFVGGERAIARFALPPEALP